MHNAQQIREIILLRLNLNNISTNKMLLDLGINTSLVNDMRKGQMPAADKLGAIADYLDISLDFLLGRTDKPEVNR